jgi:hypothetical protein
MDLIHDGALFHIKTGSIPAMQSATRPNGIQMGFK